MYHSRVSIFMTFRGNLLKRDPVHVTSLVKASGGMALPQIFPVAYKAAADLTRVCLFVLILSHLLLIPCAPATAASPATRRAHLPPQASFLLSPPFPVRLRMRLPHASPSHRSGLAISSLAQRPVPVCHSAHHSLKYSYFSFFSFLVCLSPIECVDHH